MENSTENSATIVFDLGKTHAKLSLWNAAGESIARVTRANKVCTNSSGLKCLDVHGIDAWLIDSLSHFATLTKVGQIIPVAHGAAFALIKENTLVAAPLDYEDEIEADILKQYLDERDAFEVTGSPALPCGLNLGAQIYRYEAKFGKIPAQTEILTWPQYWAWRFSGVSSSEWSSLGCHTDLWDPANAQFSPMAKRLGWADKFAPVRGAADKLSTISAQLQAETGLSPECVVHCGIHDSNAALVAARGCTEIAEGELTALSTGTWFIAMRSLHNVGDDAGAFALNSAHEARDCLINVGPLGNPIPSARFMGGREFELLGGIADLTDFDQSDTYEWERRLQQMLAGDSFILPSMASGTGPFPSSQGRWINKPKEAVNRHILIQMYLALMINTTLQLIDSKNKLLLEGRFSEMPVFRRVLATLNPDMAVYYPRQELDVAFGALRLIDPTLRAPAELAQVRTLPLNLSDYAARWRAHIDDAHIDDPQIGEEVNK